MSTKLEPIKFWCQKVLPLVYDDSLSYYEVLGKTVDYLNKVIEDDKNIIELVNNLEVWVNENKEYIDNYFENLNVQNEINVKLDEMVDDGTFGEIIDPILEQFEQDAMGNLSQQVSDWLEKNITPTTPVIDATLTISGAGADAKVTGDKITDLKNAITEIVQHTGEEGTYTIDLSKYDTALGTFDASGKLASASTRIVTRSFIDISQFESIKVIRTNGYRYNIAFYADADENTWISNANTPWVLDDHAMARIGKYARITAYDPNGGTVAPSDFSAFTVTGLNYRTAEKELKQLIDETTEHDKIFVDLTTKLERGALVNGSPASATSYVRSVDFIPVYDYESVTLYGDEQAERIKVILYDSNKAYLRDATAQNGFPYSVDLSNVSYIKITLGMTGAVDVYSADAGFLVACFTKLSEFNKTGKNPISISNLFAMYSMTRGALSSASSRISTQHFINISDYDVITVKPLNGYYFGISFYSQANENTYLYMYPWSNTEIAFDTSNVNFCRVTMRRSDNAGMQASEGSNIELYGYPKKSSYVLGTIPSIPSKLAYDGERISLKPTYNYYNILKNLSQIYDTAYPFAGNMQQGATIFNDYAFMFRHHAKCTVLNLNDYSVNEFSIADIPSNSHCNSANFSTVYPSGNTDFPYLYVGRCAYTSEAEEGETTPELQECFVFNATTASMTLVQRIRYMNENGDFSYSTWDWMVDNDRNRLIAIGFAEAYEGARRSYIFKEFNLPSISDGAVITLTESDIVNQWQVPDCTLQAFQGGTVHDKYVIIPISNSESEDVAVYDKYAHRMISKIHMVRTETGELQSASVYKGNLYIFAADARIDKIIFD